MGGRGASSGISARGNKYGSQYHTLMEQGNIKFVTKNSRQSEALMETMTAGRVYATINGNTVQRITFFDNENKRNKVIEIDKRTGKWHVHKGYFHAEKSDNAHDQLTASDKKMLDKVLRLWNNRR